MAQCSEPASASSAMNGEPRRERKVAVITGITGQVTFLSQPSDGVSTCMSHLLTGGVLKDVVPSLNNKNLNVSWVVVTETVCFQPASGAQPGHC